jgi:hypothetical protein
LLDSYLYQGENGLKQQVLTWLATQMVEEFDGDIAPFLTQLVEAKLGGLPSSKDYVGHVSFGSEAFSADKAVTFNVPRLSIDIQAAGPPTTP